MSKFPELDLIDKVTKRFERFGVPFERQELGHIKYKSNTYPVSSFIIGAKNKNAPTFGLFGGVHGLEKIGTHVILNYLNSIAFRYAFNESLAEKFKRVRIVSIPMVNPVGVRHNKRGNGNGVDLMRNSPTKAVGKTIPLASGHRLSSKIWWYQGQEDVLEEESKILINFVEKEIFESYFSMALDVHSGFGVKDRLWYPYSKTQEPFPLESEVVAFKRMMKLVNPFHIYHVESQSDAYLINGDLWDHLYDLKQAASPINKNIFIPWTLEMGSWNWVKKNPFQIFQSTGMFHPIKKHRVHRIMRRHWWLLDFFSNFVSQTSF